MFAVHQLDRNNHLAVVALTVAIDAFVERRWGWSDFVTGAQRLVRSPGIAIFT
jgi:hypothetical protein